MTNRSKFLVTVLLLLGIALLAGMDAFLNRRELTAYLPTDAGRTDDAAPSGDETIEGKDITAIITAQGFTTAGTNEVSLLGQVITRDSAVQGLSILQEGDRAGSIAWTTSPQVQTTFIALKEALLPAFSPQVRDLRDITDASPGRPVRHILRFTDPGLGEDGFAFVRTGNRLYEFHIRAGKEEVMEKLMDALTLRGLVP